ncbi:MAG TPA: hypothetical protein V6D17_21620 [Candidatus Obscuribacterales bacterium]
MKDLLRPLKLLKSGDAPQDNKPKLYIVGGSSWLDGTRKRLVARRFARVPVEPQELTEEQQLEEIVQRRRTLRMSLPVARTSSVKGLARWFTAKGDGGQAWTDRTEEDLKMRARISESNKSVRQKFEQLWYSDCSTFSTAERPSSRKDDEIHMPDITFTMAASTASMSDGNGVIESDFSAAMARLERARRKLEELRKIDPIAPLPPIQEDESLNPIEEHECAFVEERALVVAGNLKESKSAEDATTPASMEAPVCAAAPTLEVDNASAPSAQSSNSKATTGKSTSTTKSAAHKEVKRANTHVLAAIANTSPPAKPDGAPAAVISYKGPEETAQFVAPNPEPQVRKSVFGGVRNAFGAAFGAAKSIAASIVNRAESKKTASSLAAPVKEVADEIVAVPVPAKTTKARAKSAKAIEAPAEGLTEAKQAKRKARAPRKAEAAVAKVPEKEKGVCHDTVLFSEAAEILFDASERLLVSEEINDQTEKAPLRDMKKGRRKKAEAEQGKAVADPKTKKRTAKTRSAETSESQASQSTGAKRKPRAKTAEPVQEPGEAPRPRRHKSDSASSATAAAKRAKKTTS